jgi:hypothetical protein
LKGSNSSASSGTPENRQNNSIISGNVNHESAVPQAQENEFSLLQFDQPTPYEEHDDVEQLNADAEVLQLSENTDKVTKALQMSAQHQILQSDEVLAPIADRSIGRPAL